MKPSHVTMNNTAAYFQKYSPDTLKALRSALLNYLLSDLSTPNEN